MGGTLLLVVARRDRPAGDHARRAPPRGGGRGGGRGEGGEEGKPAAGGAGEGGGETVPGVTRRSSPSLSKGGKRARRPAHYTFAVANEGKIEHDLAIEGNGSKRGQDAADRPGKKRPTRGRPEAREVQVLLHRSGPRAVRDEDRCHRSLGVSQHADEAPPQPVRTDRALDVRDHRRGRRDRLDRPVGAGAGLHPGGPDRHALRRAGARVGVRAGARDEHPDRGGGPLPQAAARTTCATASRSTATRGWRWSGPRSPPC